MLYTLTALAGLSAAGAIAADWRERRPRAFYVLKPLTTALIIAIAALAPALQPDYRHWVLVALSCSLAGDACLMFRGDRWFLAGLTSFLVAHLAFVAAFLQGVGQAPLPAWLGAVVLYAVVLLAILLRRAGPMKVPVVLYCVALAAMVFAAAARTAAFRTDGATLALAGALLFMLSDSLLGIRQFVRPYPGAQPLILSTYWAAIGLIALSV